MAGGHLHWRDQLSGPGMSVIKTTYIIQGTVIALQLELNS